jgi:hypothetical protein
MTVIKPGLLVFLLAGETCLFLPKTIKVHALASFIESSIFNFELRRIMLMHSAHHISVKMESLLYEM